jgi:outer membrane protein assembly factor BamB
MPPGGLAPQDNVTFDGSGSTDPDSTITSWSLSFGDGSQQVTGTGAPPSPTATHNYRQAGDYQLTMTVTDANGVSATAPFTFIVKPSLTLLPSTSPPTGTVVVLGRGYQPGEPVSISLNGQPWGSATASTTGAVSSAPLVVPGTIPSGTYHVTVTGQWSGILGTSILVDSARWQFRYSAAGGSFNPNETVIGVGNVASLVPAPWEGTASQAITSSPAVVNGDVFAGSLDGNLREWNSATYVQWRALPSSGAIVSSPFILGPHVYVGSEDGKVYGYADYCGPPSSGGCRPTLTIATGGPIESSPVGTSERLYVGSDDGKLYAIDTHASRVLWSTPLGGPVRSSAALALKTVVVGSGNNVYALDTSTGAVQWSATTGGAVTSSPVIVGNSTVVVGSQDGRLYAFPLNCSSSCPPQWTVTTGGPIESSPAVAHGVLFIGSDDGALYAFSLKQHSLIWKATTGGAVVSSPAVANGVVYVGSQDGKLYALDAAGCGGPITCSPLWSATTGGPVTSSPGIADGQVYVGSGDGHLYVYALPAAKSQGQ